MRKQGERDSRTGRVDMVGRRYGETRDCGRLNASLMDQSRPSLQKLKVRSRASDSESACSAIVLRRMPDRLVGKEVLNEQ